MKKTILTLLIVLCPVFTFASGYIHVTSTKSMNVSEKNDSAAHVSDTAEQMPSFPGGNQALLNYLYRNIRYPEAAVSQGKQGRVIVSFIVESDGSITEASIKQSVYPSLDKEALRLINKMPKWIPGKINDQNVRVCLSLPVEFRLNSGSRNNDSNESIYRPVDQTHPFSYGYGM